MYLTPKCAALRAVSRAGVELFISRISLLLLTYLNKDNIHTSRVGTEYRPKLEVSEVPNDFLLLNPRHKPNLY